MRAIDKVIAHARRHHDCLRFPAEYFARFIEGISTLNELRLKHPDIVKKARAVEIEAYKIKGYMRFVPFENLLAGVYRSRHIVSDLVGLQFKKRYPACHVLTWNETTRDGCYTFPEVLGASIDALAPISGHPLRKEIPPGIMLNCILHHFTLTPGTDFKNEFVVDIAKLLFPDNISKIPAVFDKHEFAEQWNVYYDTQAIDSRIDYVRAQKMLGKRHAIDQLGQDSIEVQRVLKKVPKGQKRLLDF
nr:DUF4130 domain-containing protein [Candidatus Sigynarchaeota archaeon]